MIRIATAVDADLLCALERAASTAGLSHVFGEIPFPDADVLARWAIVLDDPAATVLIDEEDGEPVGYAAVAGNWLQHLGVVPAWWGTGRGNALYGAALDVMGRTGASEYRLWVLVENQRARAFYARRGWVDTDIREIEEFAPYPERMQMTLPIQSDQAGLSVHLS